MPKCEIETESARQANQLVACRSLLVCLTPCLVNWTIRNLSQLPLSMILPSDSPIWKGDRAQRFCSNLPAGQVRTHDHTLGPRSPTRNRTPASCSPAACRRIGAKIIEEAAEVVEAAGEAGRGRPRTLHPRNGRPVLSPAGHALPRRTAICPTSRPNSPADSASLVLEEKAARNQKPAGKDRAATKTAAKPVKKAAKKKVVKRRGRHAPSRKSHGRKSDL